jgi:hypothetical protein
MNRTLVVEEGAKETLKAIDLMNNSGLPYELAKVPRKEAAEARSFGDEFPRLLTYVGFFPSLRHIEWFVMVYGKDGPWYDHNLRSN